MVHLCLIDPGDVGLVPDPSYSSYQACVQLAGGLVEKVPLLKENGFLPNLDKIPLKQPKSQNDLDQLSQ